MTPMPKELARFASWIGVLLWIGVGLGIAVALPDALDRRLRSVQLGAEALLWIGWGVGMLATAIPHPISLTASRIIAPGSAIAALGVFAFGGRPWIGLVLSVIAALYLCSSVQAARCVNGPAYPNELRLLLRTPAPYVVGPLPFACVLVSAVPAAAVLLLGAHSWLAGGALALVSVPLCFAFVRAIHQLSLRWLVFVPAGLVVHDLMTMTDPVLVARKDVVSFEAAPAGTDAFDITEGAFGLALELKLKESTLVTRKDLRKRTTNAFHVFSFVVAPVQAKRALDGWDAAR